MIIDANLNTEKQVFDADICILGAGVAGITLALELRKLNKRVVMITGGSTIYEMDSQELYKGESIPKYFPNPMYSRLRMLGGSSNHWENSTERFDPIDFESRPWISDSGWPISYSDILPFYPQAEEYCGVGGNGYDYGFWAKQIKFTDHLSGSRHFETAFTKFSTPPTRFYEQYKKALTSQKNLDILIHSNFKSVEFDESANRIRSVQCVNDHGIPLTISTGKVVMAFGGLENSRQLLNVNRQYNDKVGNHHDNVGRYFMEHPTIRALLFYPFDQSMPDVYNQGIAQGDYSVRARVKMKESAQRQYETFNMRLLLQPRSKLELSHGIASSHILKEHLADGDMPDDFGLHATNILGDLDLILDTVSRKLFDTKLFDDSDSFGGYQFISMIEQTPDRQNRIKLGQSSDKIGIPKLVVDYRVTDSDKLMSWKTLDLLSQDNAMTNYGRFRVLKEREERIWASQLGFAQHHLGGTRMGQSEKTGVVDRDCRVFGVNNLYMAGSSLFPTGGHVPPTLTITAMSIRLARHLEEIS